MQTTCETNPQDFFRMEKSIINKKNMDALTSLTKDHIPEAILYFVCKEHQYNMFGYGRIDPEEFAKKFGFSFRYLQEKHDNPYQKIIFKAVPGKNDNLRFRNTDAKEEHLYDNRFENALFLLANMPLMVEATIVNDDKRLVRKFTSLRVFKNLYVEQDKVTGKITYAYELDEDFRRNLSNFYLQTNSESLNRLRRSGSALLYHHLLRLRDALFVSGRTSTNSENTPKFAYLCELGGINSNQEPKYMKRDLNKLFNKINKETELDFNVEWVKDGNGERYIPVFHFIPKLGEVLDDNSRRYWNIIRGNERLDIAFVEFAHNLIQDCPYRTYENMDKAEELFFEWIKTDTPEQHKKIEYILSKTFVNINCPIPLNLKEKATTFINAMQEVNIENFEQLTKGIFDPLCLRPHPTADNN